MNLNNAPLSDDGSLVAEAPATTSHIRSIDNILLDDLGKINSSLETKYKRIFSTEYALNRGLVSFQANRTRPKYRWYKYKEAFSADLVENFLENFNISKGVILDPFAGSGTALFASSARGLAAEGIELLPIGHAIISTRILIEQGLSKEDIRRLGYWAEKLPWRLAKSKLVVPELGITRGAYPQETQDSIARFLATIESENNAVKSMLMLALLCILESVSFTRKDGQYLRWDYRSGRRAGKKRFDKGEILPFDRAMQDKLRGMLADLCAVAGDIFDKPVAHGRVNLRRGSCLDLMPLFPPASFEAIITSPPYCNRYDYTRTYALELAMLGADEAGLRTLRQEMLSCTVENRAKDLLAKNPAWEKAITAADREELLQALLAYLEEQRRNNQLNNNGIPRMVRGYFYEMACVIAECARSLKPGCPLIMVNDNVRYAGAPVSVDIILSEIAAKLGFKIEKILVLPNGKGNSSQQMGRHGRESLRKCVYLWRRK